MVVEINFNEKSINGKKFSSDKEFKASLAVIALGKNVGSKAKPIYKKAKNLDSVEFIARPARVFDGIACPTFNADERKVIKLVLINNPTLDITAVKADKSIAVTSEQLDKFDEESFDFVLEKELKESLSELVDICFRHRELKSILLGYGYNIAERLELVAKAFINDSGYDVSLSSLSPREGKLIYNFNDGHNHIEGCRSVTKKYEVPVESLLDVLKMYENCKYYQSIGLAPEKPVEREQMLRRSAVAQGIEFHYANDIDDLPLEIIEKWLKGDDEYEVPVSASGKYTQMLFE